MSVNFLVESILQKVSPNMRIELVVSFLSTFQIYHQSAPYAMMDLNLTKNELSLISAAFPSGKFFGTLATPMIYRYLFFITI